MVTVRMGTTGFVSQRVLAGRYRLDHQLQKGGMGTIWRAEHLTLQAPVAVKLIDRDAVPDEDTVARFLREAKAAANLRSPHVVQILDYGMEDGVPFIVMELLEGETLAQRLRRTGPLPVGEVVRIVSHIGRAVARAHEAGIVHRDLKPENVFLVHNEDEEIAKVLDFGVAKIGVGGLGTDSARTRTGSILGTPFYMSPEQAQGNKTVDHRSDLWSIGVIGFECITGKRPFSSDGLGELVLQICVRDIPVPSEVAAVPPGFDAWFQKAVAREPDHRFQSAREMTDALRESLGVEGRETSTALPEVLVTVETPSREEPGASGDHLRTSAPTEPSSRSPSTVQAMAGPEAPTVPAPGDLHVTAEPMPAASETMARSVRLSPPPPASTGLGSVVAVAGFALALGLGGGLYVLRRVEPPRPVVRQPVQTTASPAASRAETAPSPPVLGASADPAPSTSASAAPASAAAGRAGLVEPRVPPPDAFEPPPVDQPDAGWVKPDWAIPDGEPIKVHGPADEIEDGQGP